MPRLRRVSGRSITLLLGGIVLAMMGSVVWVVLQGPPKFLATLGLESAPEPLETAPYALLVSSGQEQLANGDFEEAIETFEHAFANGEKKAARSLRNHAVAVRDAGPSGACQLRGLGHPRPFDRTTKTSRPTLSWSGQQLIAAWSAESNPEQTAVHATRLDSALRRVSPEQLSTPDVTEARDPLLLGSATGLSLLYTDARGKASLIFGRALDPDGNPQGPPSLLTDSDSAYAYDPTMVQNADGTYWVAYTQATDKRVHDLYLRHADKALAPLSAPVRMTAYAPPKKGRAVASLSNIALGHGLINLVYRLQRGSSHQVIQLRVSPDSPKLQTGGVKPVADSPVKAGDEESDRFIGQAIALSESAGRQAQPNITCLEAGCITVWSDEAHGAEAAFVRNDTGEVLWRRNFSEKGSQPALAQQSQKAVVVWYEKDLVKVASIDETGVGQPSVVGAVKGLHPPPEVVAGAEPGQWYISWRSYEAAQFEPFVARVDCH